MNHLLFRFSELGSFTGADVIKHLFCYV